jgi:hypothetical protein
MEGEGPLRRGGDGKCGTLTLGRVGKGLSLPAAAGVAERELASWGMEWSGDWVGVVWWRQQQQRWGGGGVLSFSPPPFLWPHCLLVFHFVFLLRVGPWKGTAWISESSVDHGQACCVQLLIWSYRLKQLLGAPDTNVEVRV